MIILSLPSLYYPKRTKMTEVLTWDPLTPKLLIMILGRYVQIIFNQESFQMIENNIFSYIDDQTYIIW